MSLAVAILSLPSLVLWIQVSIGVVVRLLGGAADRDLDHRNRPGRNPKCSREAASQAGFRRYALAAWHSLGRVIRRKVRPRRRSPPPTRMRLRSMTGWLPPLVAVVLALAVGGSARADVCVVVNPVLDIGCRDVQGAPAGGEPTASSAPAGASREQEPMVRSSTAVRYDPRR